MEPMQMLHTGVSVIPVCDEFSPQLGRKSVVNPDFSKRRNLENTELLSRSVSLSGTGIRRFAPEFTVFSYYNVFSKIDFWAK